MSFIICKIAELITEIPTEGGLATLCTDYLLTNSASITPDVVINPSEFRLEKYATLPQNDIYYMEAGRLFNAKLLDYNGLFLHSSAIEYEGRAFLFSGNCGVGKSTHTSLWQSTFGDSVRIINDDKPALRKIDGKWFAYGTPFSGKNHVNINAKAPLCGICFLKQGQQNCIRRLTPFEAAQKILTQTFNKFKKAENLDTMLSLINDIVLNIPVFELENRPEEAAARLSRDTMLSAAKEIGL